MGEDALRWSRYRGMPWKNGGGVTREVASGAVQAPLASVESTDGFDWRVSVADVDAGGSFSAFPGIDRVITPVEGEGMVLTVDGTAHPVWPLSPFAFSGDAATDCRLEAGAVRNLNVMTRRSRATAQVRIITVAAARVTELACAAGETLLVMAVTEGITIDGPDGQEITLGRLDCVRHEGPAALTLRGDGVVAGITITAVR
ncbi:HutD family protein [Streptomyces sp. WI04-05B]|uniref:HutD family protein n=1 Tax=Streptomyces TaxID=1883 RepID=UPI0029A61030|nr:MULTISPECIES: HutD family protein [Streptomyces]MDX2548636.1 HutD family protein [Streptomyces sp. WI04-05B]MDX2589043.1 HutD family protein [Streptomyces sp. WI04-05A]MDX3746546.1 HutD family protein [Streptomyces sp. AK08-02]